MKQPGRNDPCPCGSGRKYKHCCLESVEAAPRFTQADRGSSFAKLERFTELVAAEERDDAFDEFWEEEGAALEDLEEPWAEASTDAFDMWFWFDRPLSDGRLLADRVLEEVPSLTSGERHFLALARQTCMRLYEVVDVLPGVSVTLQDLLQNARVTVHEERGSRQLVRSELLAARIIRSGVSAQPEIEAGVLPMSRLLRTSLLSQASALLAELRRETPGATSEACFKEMTPFFHSAFVTSILNPPIPRLANTDGEDMLITRTHFDVRDSAKLVLNLSAGGELEREGTKAVWHWSGANREGKPVVLGRLELQGESLMLETNSVARGERGRALIERLAGDAVAHRATSHEDLTQSLREALGSGRDETVADAAADEIPAEVQQDLMLDHHARHYRQWLDDPIPALDGRTPRDAAKHPALRSRLAGLIRGLEGMYQMALRSNEPAYDPSWMWAELGFEDRAQPAHPPPLAHERWVDSIPGWSTVCSAVVGRLRGLPGFDDASSSLSRKDLENDLVVRRFLQDRREQADLSGDRARAAGDALLRKLRCTINYELHRRKTFWVDEALVYMLAQTELDIVGDELRVPFRSFALVFTDRHMLSLAERLLAADPASELAGLILRVLTVYVTEADGQPHRVLHVGFACDALGADLPRLVEHEIRVSHGAPVEIDSTPGRTEVLYEGGDPVPGSRPLPGLLKVVVNAILYATSAGVEPEVLTSPRPRASHGATTQAAFTSEEVFFLPGSIQISRLRQMQELERVPSGRTLLHRFMVRGHWRRPAKTWKEQRMRWIEPYWKGPDLAAVIERTYKLTP